MVTALEGFIMLIATLIIGLAFGYVFGYWKRGWDDDIKKFAKSGVTANGKE